jgi:hypothetical protein
MTMNRPLSTKFLPSGWWLLPAAIVSAIVWWLLARMLAQVLG